MIFLSFFHISLYASSQTATASWYPFPMNTSRMSSDSEIDMSYLNHPINGHLEVISDGHFYNKEGNRVRFFGTNVIYSNAFPLKEKAPSLAKRMAQIGINVVRFHHMDNANIWKKPVDGSNKYVEFDPEMVDRLHYFIKCLGDNGIYTNLNLHVSREYPLKEFIDNEDLRSSFSNGKPLDRFYEPFIDLQIKYAKDLLGVKNEYTGKMVGQDPFVAFIEINNENSLHYLMDDGKINKIKGTVFETALIEKWHKYLTDNYETYENLKKEWNPISLNESNNIANGIAFDKYMEDGSTLTQDEITKIYTVNITKEAVDSIQIALLDVPIESTTFYTVKFKANVDSGQRKFNIFFQNYRDGYDELSDEITLTLTSEMKEFNVVLKTYSYDSISPNLLPKKFVISFGIGSGVIHLESIPEIYIGREVEYSINNSIEGIGLPYFKELTSSDSDVASDSGGIAQINEHFRLFIDFTENITHKRILKFLKEEIGVRSLITDSQSNYGSFLSLHRQSEVSDFQDIHNYWDQPQFPIDQDMNYDLYWIKNKPMVSDQELGTFSFMSVFQVDGKPFTVSEYNTAFPNEYMAELLPLVSSWGAFHDWDAIYQFDFNQIGNYAEKENEYVSSFYSMSENPSTMTFAPFAALAFRNYGVKTAEKVNIATIPLKMLKEKNKERRPNYWSFTQWKESTNVFYPGITKVKFSYDDKNTIDFNQESIGCGMPFVTPEIEWRIENKKGTFVVKGEKIQMATGFWQKTINFDNFLITLSKREEEDNSNDTVTAGIASLDDRNLNESHKILFALIGKVANTDQTWDAERTSTRANWGKGPVLVKSVPFEVILKCKTKPTVKLLDPEGIAVKNVTVEMKNGYWTFSSDQQSPSVWFLITRDGITDSQNTTVFEDEDEKETIKTDEKDPNYNNNEQKKKDDQKKKKTIIIAISVSVTAVVVIIIVIVAVILVKKKNVKKKPVSTDSPMNSDFI